MLPTAALCCLDGLMLQDLVVADQRIVVVLAAEATSAACPQCTHHAERAQSRYVRTLHDLPFGERPVQVQLEVRRFRCRNRTCPQVIFAERFPDVTAAHARRTHRQRAALEQVGFALGGAPGARLAKHLRLAVSRSTLLRLIQSAPLPVRTTPRVLGVDDWAWRRGQTYGTLLVDLERQQPVDLLPDRTAETFATWLATHPGIEVIARDRAGAYADGARQGAPEAVQVADRWHLLKNIGEVLERVLARHQRPLRAAAEVVDRAQAEATAPAAGATNASAVTGDDSPTGTRPRAEAAKQTRRAARLARYEAVVALQRQGHSTRAIARQLQLSRTTVRRFMRADVFPERAVRAKRPASVTPFEPYLRERWAAGCHNARVLWQEIRDRGCRGSPARVRQIVAAWRPAPGRSGPTPRRPRPDDPAPTPPPPEPTRVRSPRQARWLLLREEDALTSDEIAYRQHLLDAAPEVRQALALVLAFGRLVRERDHPGLEPWLAEAEASGITELRTFGQGIRRDRAAVDAAVRLHWSNGQTEGQVNRLKGLKRQMYGRAGFPLLRQRVLQAA